MTALKDLKPKQIRFFKGQQYAASSYTSFPKNEQEMGSGRWEMQLYPGVGILVRDSKEKTDTLFCFSVIESVIFYPSEK